TPAHRPLRYPLASGLRRQETARCVLCTLSEPALTTNQAPKLARLLVRQSPGLPSLTILDHDTSCVAGDDLKRAGREIYGHGGSLNVAYHMRHHYAANATGCDLPPLLNDEGNITIPSAERNVVKCPRLLCPAFDAGTFGGSPSTTATASARFTGVQVAGART